MTDALLLAGALVLFIGLLMWGYRLLAAVPDDEPDWTAEAQQGLVDWDVESKATANTVAIPVVYTEISLTADTVAPDEEDDR